MLRLFALILVAAMVFAICVGVGEVRISFAGSEALPDAISTTLGDLRQPVENLLDGAGHGVEKRLAAPSVRPSSGSAELPAHPHGPRQNERRWTKVG
jgi:hypothetical protein